MSEATAATEPGDGTTTAGMLLRQAREAAGLHVATLAVSLKVPVRKLEALEQDRYEELPDAVFARGLASSVCRALKIDPQPVLERLPQGKARLRADDGINAPFRAPGDRAPPGMLDPLMRPVGLAVSALLLGAVVILFLPKLRQDDAPAASKPAMVTPAGMAEESPLPPAVSTPGPMVSEPAVAVQPPASAAAAAPAARPAASAASAPARPASSPTASTSTSMSSTVAFTPTGGEPVSFRARGASWIQVTDARGTVVLQRLMNAGDTAGAGGTLPLTVIVGNVDATDIEVHGKPHDLRGQARDNVARFQVR
jgi:cytoskeleton protein RodZ